MLKETPGMSLRRFAKKLDYRSSADREFKAILRMLIAKGMVKVQQSGFYADSMHHQKLVVILKPIELDYFKRKVLTRTNFKIGDFRVHQSIKKRKCDKCHATINYGQRYGVKVKIGRRQRRTRRRTIYAATTLCLHCIYLVSLKNSVLMDSSKEDLS